MTRFEPQTIGIGSNRSDNLATTATKISIWKVKSPLMFGSSPYKMQYFDNHL